MAAPNLLSLTTVTGKSVQAALTTTLTTDILANAAASGKLLKIDSIIVANIDGTSSADVSLYIVKNGGSPVAIASTVAVAADSTSIISDRSVPIYLEENDTLEGGASANGDLVITVNYVEMS